jgi:hypothetical protein
MFNSDSDSPEQGLGANFGHIAGHDRHEL